MQIFLNGQAYTLPADSSLTTLLHDAKLVNKRIAVEVNQEIIPRTLHADYQLSEGDAVEIIHAVGGG